MNSTMFFGMGFFWLIPILVIGLLVWLLASLFKDDSNQQHK